MRLDNLDHQSVQSNARKSEPTDKLQGLLTPARRAALDALERELRELLQPR